MRVLGFLYIFITAAKGYVQTQQPLQHHTPYPLQCPQYPQPYYLAYQNIPQVVPPAYYPDIPVAGYIPQIVKPAYYPDIPVTGYIPQKVPSAYYPDIPVTGYIPQIVPPAFYSDVPVTGSPAHLPQILGTLGKELESLIPVALKGSEIGAKGLVSALLPGIEGFETLKKRFKASEYISNLWTNGYAPRFTGSGLSWS